MLARLLEVFILLKCLKSQNTKLPSMFPSLFPTQSPTGCNKIINPIWPDNADDIWSVSTSTLNSDNFEPFLSTGDEAYPINVCISRRNANGIYESRKFQCSSRNESNSAILQIFMGDKCLSANAQEIEIQSGLTSNGVTCNGQYECDYWKLRRYEVEDTTQECGNRTGVYQDEMRVLNERTCHSNTSLTEHSYQFACNNEDQLLIKQFNDSLCVNHSLVNTYNLNEENFCVAKNYSSDLAGEEVYLLLNPCATGNVPSNAPTTNQNAMCSKIVGPYLKTNITWLGNPIEISFGNEETEFQLNFCQSTVYVYNSSLSLVISSKFRCNNKDAQPAEPDRLLDTYFDYIIRPESDIKALPSQPPNFVFDNSLCTSSSLTSAKLYYKSLTSCGRNINCRRVDYAFQYSTAIYTPEPGETAADWLQISDTYCADDFLARKIGSLSLLAENNQCYSSSQFSHVFGEHSSIYSCDTNKSSSLSLQIYESPITCFGTPVFSKDAFNSGDKMCIYDGTAQQVMLVRLEGNPCQTSSSSSSSTTTTCAQLTAANPNVRFCADWPEGDYTQALAVVGFLLLIKLGGWFLQFPISRGKMWVVDEAFDVEKVSAITSTRGMKENAPQFNRLFELAKPESGGGDDSIGNLPKPMYVALSAIIIALYFVIKMVALTSTQEEEGRYFTNVVGNWNEQGAKEFLRTSENYILLGLLSVSWNFSMPTLYMALSLFTEEHVLVYGIAYVTALVCLLDLVGSFICICIWWPMLVLSLYVLSVSLLVMCMLSCAFVCTLCFVGVVMVVVGGVFRVIGMIVSCCRSVDSSPVGRHVFMIGISVAFLVVFYFVGSLAYVFVFLFVGGPNKAFFYIELCESCVDSIIVSIFTAIYVLGIVCFVMGIGAAYYKHFFGSELTKGAHKSVATHESKDLDVAAVVNEENRIFTGTGEEDQKL